MLPYGKISKEGDAGTIKPSGTAMVPDGCQSQSVSMGRGWIISFFPAIQAKHPGCRSEPAVYRDHICRAWKK